MPTVDLLPEKQRADLKHRRTLPKLFVAVVASVVAAGGVYLAGSIPEQAGMDRLAAAEETGVELLAELSAQSGTKVTQDDAKALEEALNGIAPGEVEFAGVANELTDRLPAGMQITSFEGALVSAQAQSPSSGSSCVPEAATMTIALSGTDLSQSASYAESLESVPGFSCVMSTQVSRNQSADETNVTMQIALSADAFTNRHSEGIA